MPTTCSSSSSGMLIIQMFDFFLKQEPKFLGFSLHAFFFCSCLTLTIQKVHDFCQFPFRSCVAFFSSFTCLFAFCCSCVFCVENCSSVGIVSFMILYDSLLSGSLLIVCLERC